MAHATIITAITIDNKEHVLLYSDGVAKTRRNMARALRHYAFKSAEVTDARIEFPIEILLDARIGHEIKFIDGLETCGRSFINDVETSSQAVMHITNAQSELKQLLATGAAPRLFVSIH